MKPVHLLSYVLVSGSALVSLLPACNSLDSSSKRFVLLESDSYACGVESGLGCGLALAPALSALDELESVAESRVSWDGRTFRIELEPGAAAGDVVAAAEGLLEGEERLVAPAAAQAQGNQHWWDAAGTVELSRHEAKVLAADFRDDIAAAAALDDAERDRLGEILVEELTRAFERAHAEGGGVHRLWEQFPEARSAFEQRLDFLAPDKRAQVSAYLDEELAP